MLKIFQVMLQQCVNQGFPDVQAGFRKGRGTRDQIVNIHLITEKVKEFQKSIYFSFIDYAKVCESVYHNKLWNIRKEMGIYKTTLPVSWKTCMWVKKQQLEPEKEKYTDSKLGKEYGKAVYCHPVWRWKWTVLRPVQLFVTPWTKQSRTFSRPEYWNW